MLLTGRILLSSLYYLHPPSHRYSVHGGNPWIYLYDLMYNLIIILIMVAIITGIIIDTFADMRGQQVRILHLSQPQPLCPWHPQPYEYASSRIRMLCPTRAASAWLQSRSLTHIAPTLASTGFHRRRYQGAVLHLQPQERRDRSVSRLQDAHRMRAQHVGLRMVYHVPPRERQ